MITRLPLLFARGRPKTLSGMTVEEMETFIPFMVRCSTREPKGRPPWWPGDVGYPDLRRAGCAPDEWRRRLRNLIEACYRHNDGDLLLRFSNELGRRRPEEVEFRSNGDGTTSVHCRPKGGLLVTFRNENMHYDRTVSPKSRRCLLPRRFPSPAPSVPSSPSPPQIYLCDTCDDAFDGLTAFREHEAVCPPHKATVPLPAPSPEPPRLDGFLLALGLRPVGAEPAKAEEPPPERSRGTMLSSGPFHFPFSSPAGRRSLKLRRTWHDPARQRDHAERYCAAMPGARFPPAPPPHRPTRSRRGDGRGRHRRLPGQRGKIILDLDAQLLFLTCRPCRVQVLRLPLEALPLPSSPAVPEEIIDLCSDDENVHPARAVPNKQAPSAGGRDTTLRPLQQCQVSLQRYASNVILID